MDTLDLLSLAGIVPVIKIDDANDAVPLCAALARGGLPVAEITFRTDAAEQAIRNVRKSMPDVLLGAGTVLSAEQVDRAAEAGAGYIVSPGLNPEVVKRCQILGLTALPGCASPSDIETALGLGITTVKFFPAEALGGLPLIKALSAPYGQVRFVPTGGIHEGNAAAYLAFPKIRAIGGSWMVPDDAVKARDWERIERLTRSAVDKMLGFTLRHIGISGGSPEQAERDAQSLSRMLGWPVREGSDRHFVGTGFEVIKASPRGARGHIAIGTNSVERARWHLARRGAHFEEASVVWECGQMTELYFQEEIAGYALRLIKQ